MDCQENKLSAAERIKRNEQRKAEKLRNLKKEWYKRNKETKKWKEIKLELHRGQQLCTLGIFFKFIMGSGRQCRSKWPYYTHAL